MAQGLLDDAARAMEGTLMRAGVEARWNGAVLDSRRVGGGELFFALAGERTDGHLHVAQALERGASAAVIERSVTGTSEGALIRVADTYQALHALTRSVRRRLPEHLVAVTGSAGKTTTKRLLTAMLACRFRTAPSPGNLNNLYGFPLALLGIPDDCEWMVAEMGMSTPGELGQVSRLGKPDVALFTNVRPAHLEAFGSLRAVADAKAELLEGLTAGGLVVANADDPEVRRIGESYAGPTAWYGIDTDAEYSVADLESRGADGTRLTLRTGELSWDLQLPLLGRYNVENFLAAAACAHRLGVDGARLCEAAEAIAPAPGRGVSRRLPGGGLLVDDSYNSNPDALERSLAAARGVPGGRHWAVLGAMLELGADSPRFHREAGSSAAHQGFSPVLGVGEEARELVAAAAAAGARALWVEDAAAAAEVAVSELGADDVVLVKGSRGVGLEIVVDRLLQESEGG